MSNRRPCDKDCEHCKYPDCVYDRLDVEDYAQSRELDRELGRELTQSPAAKNGRPGSVRTGRLMLAV